MTSWEKEKAYRVRRAAALGAEMDAAIESLDEERFTKAFQTALNYMRRKEHTAYMIRFIIARKGATK